MKSLKQIINAFKIKLFKNKEEEQNIVYQHLQSNKLEKKLALLIKDFESVDQADLKDVEYKKMNTNTESDLFFTYRLDFHTRDKLYYFKKKYRSILL